MRHKIQLIILTFLGIAAVLGCKKVPDLPYYPDGNAVTLSASTTTVAPSAADSTKNVITFSWTSPNYATDTSRYKFTLEIDSTGRNFSQESTHITVGANNISFTGKQLNDILAGFGFTPGQSFSFDIRVTSSYLNNNEPLLSNVIKVDIASYVVPITLSASSTAPLVLQVNNASNTAVSFNWNASPFGNNTINYVLQMDTAGGNFTNPQEKKINTALTTSFTVNELNSLAIAAGVIGGTTKDAQFRVLAFIGTSTTPLATSNTVTINLTTFTPIPSTLYIVGDATGSGWSNPVSVPSQQFSRIDAVSFGIIVHLEAGKSYLFLPANGRWDHKYGGSSATGGALLADGAVPGSNTPSPGATGDYEIIVNFQTATYTVTATTKVVPDNLFIVGDATPGGWNNPVPVPDQQFTRLDAVSYGLIINLTAGNSYLFLPVNGDWSHKFGGSSATGGALLADGAVPGSNTPAPGASGQYLITVNFLTETYSVTPYTGFQPLPTALFIVGDATPGGWSNPVPVPDQQFSRVNMTQFQIVLDLTATKSYLFLPVNGDWGHKFGGSSATGGTLLYDGAVPGSNTPAPAANGTYKILVDFGQSKYTVSQY